MKTVETPDPKYPANSPLADFVEPTPQGEPTGGPEPSQPEPGEPAAPTAPAEPASFSWKHESAWKQLEQDGIEIPADYKQGKFGEGIDEWTAFRNLVIENTELEDDGPAQVDEDAFIANYKKVPPDQRAAYIKTFNDAQDFFNLDAKDGLRSWYQSISATDKEGKSVRKYEDKAIDDYLTKMSPIELDREWESARGTAKQKFDEMYNQGVAQQTQQSADRIINVNKRRVDIAKTVAAQIDTMAEFGGVPLSEEKKQQAKRDFILLNQIDPNTGKPHIMGLLNDNKNLMRFVLATTMFDGDYVNEYLSAQKENFKEVLLNEKLDIAPRPKSGTVGKPTGGNLPLP